MSRKNVNVQQKNQLRHTRRSKFEWEKGPVENSNVRIVCETGKTGYLNESAALDKLGRIAAHNLHTPQATRDTPSRCYFHDACGSWHLTHTAKRI